MTPKNFEPNVKAKQSEASNDFNIDMLHEMAAAEVQLNDSTPQTRSNRPILPHSSKTRTSELSSNLSAAQLMEQHRKQVYYQTYNNSLQHVRRSYTNSNQTPPPPPLPPQPQQPPDNEILIEDD